MEGLLYFSLPILVWELVRSRVRSQQYLETYRAERRGRTRVEQEMKRITEVQLNTAQGFFIQPIGHIRSCYKQCVGTPRQVHMFVIGMERAQMRVRENDQENRLYDLSF